ncbi:hypothetical protein OHV35_01985 [Acinetobacter baumannii]|nr:hypothetical protein [Acinetobacter baumannii]
MVNFDYVPEWHISPFQHVQYTLARNQLHMDLLFEDMDKDQIQVYGLLLHEAVHIWQIVKRRMGEREPSVEFEAYSIQAIAQDLFEMFEASEVNHGMEGEKAD